ncbi:MAG: hypothetical protein M3N09_07500 [Actinomycetota bacterium]|nr:hypothetical protein [Actinomycetota bacterium]
MDVRKNAAVEEPTDIRETAATAQEAEATKRATLEMCVTGFKSGIHWFPLALRGSSPGT